MIEMPPLPGDLREAILFRIQDIKKVIDEVEQLLCLSEEEDEKMMKKAKRESKKGKK